MTSEAEETTPAVREALERTFLDHMVALARRHVTTAPALPQTRKQFELALLRFLRDILTTVDQGSTHSADVGPFHLIAVKQAERASSAGDMLVIDIAGDLGENLIQALRRARGGAGEEPSANSSDPVES